jgi:hypothetical protein
MDIFIGTLVLRPGIILFFRIAGTEQENKKTEGVRNYFFHNGSSSFIIEIDYLR